MVRERKVFKNCPYCGASVRDINFDHHLAKVHSIVTDTVREEQEFLKEIRFIEDYVGRKSLEKPPKSLQDLEKMLEEAEVEWRRSQVPSAGTLMRFILRHHEEVCGALRRAYEEHGQPHVDLSQPMLERNEFLAKAERTGRFRETILEVEQKKREVGGSNPERWAFETQYEILSVWKPGFELYIADLFFRERCRNCVRPDKGEVECEGGLANCLFDNEFEQFQFEYVRKIVDQLKNGVEPKELEIPEHLRQIEVKMRDLGRRVGVPSGTPREYFGKAWSFEEVRSMTTDAIIDRLASFNIPIDETSFLKDVKNHYSAKALVETWQKRHRCTATELDEDFLWMAAVVLWERLAPNIVNMEMIDDEMQRGYGFLEEGETCKACDVWLNLWESIKKKLTPKMTTTEQFDEIFGGADSFSDWCCDLEQELWNAGLENPEYLRKRIQYCQEFYKQFPDEDPSVLANFYRAEAESYGYLGDIKTAEKKFKELIERYPNYAWGYIGWADGYCLFPFDKTAPKSYDKAEAIYLKALENPNTEDRADIIDRLIMLYEEKGDLDKAERYKRVIERLQGKTGPNEPCPCGSGRKHKRCCGLRATPA